MIITFYSFKGGVGRTLALANIGVVLARNHSVLAIDFDLEAPGLSRYYQNAFRSADPVSRVGLLELLQASTRGDDSLNWRDCVTPLKSGTQGRLDLITSGRQDDRYAAGVLDFDWKHFFQECSGGAVMEGLRAAWGEAYDFVLVDSRTGFTDTGGICTILLPDVLVPMFTANEQSLLGVVDVMRRAQQGRSKLARQPGPALVFPLPSRFDDRTEIELAEFWMNQFAKHLGEFYETWLPTEYLPLEILARTKLPYVPFYSFGEALPIERDRSTDAASLGYALRTAATLIEGGFENVDALLASPAASGSDPTGGPGAVAEAWRRLTRRVDHGTRALAVLTRLVGVLGTEPAVVPIDLIGDEEVISELSLEGLIVITGRDVRLADPDLAAWWKPLSEEVSRRIKLLEWARTLRDKVSDRVDYVLTGTDLAEALNWYGSAGEALTPFERALIEDSLAKRGADRPRTKVSGAAWVFVGAIAVVGGITGWALATEGGYYSLSRPATVSVVTGALAIGFMSLVAIRFWTRRLTALGSTFVPSDESWSGRRRLGLVLADFGYAGRAVGEVIVFTLHDKRPLRRGIFDRLVMSSVDPSDLELIARPGGDHAPVPGFLLDGPLFVFPRIQARILSGDLAGSPAPDSASSSSPSN